LPLRAGFGFGFPSLALRLFQIAAFLTLLFDQAQALEFKRSRAPLPGLFGMGKVLAEPLCHIRRNLPLACSIEGSSLGSPSPHVSSVIQFVAQTGRHDFV